MFVNSTIRFSKLFQQWRTCGERHTTIRILEIICNEDVVDDLDRKEGSVYNCIISEEEHEEIFRHLNQDQNISLLSLTSEKKSDRLDFSNELQTEIEEKELDIMPH